MPDTTNNQPGFWGGVRRAGGWLGRTFDQRPTQAPAIEPNPNVNPNDPRYRAGIGSRIMRGVGDFLGRGAYGAYQGATNPNAPGYFGRGALNSRYYRDLYQ